jgi:glycosyltransferase involved in cell wall biosynthesis
MRIAQISTLATPVGPTHSGSIEAAVWLLTRELTRMGHDVTVFAAAGSQVDGRLVATLPGPYDKGGSPDDWHLCEWINLCKAIEVSGHFDVMHSHAYLWGLPLEPLSQAPMVHTLHILPSDNELRLRMMWPHACITAISYYQWSGFGGTTGDEGRRTNDEGRTFGDRHLIPHSAFHIPYSNSLPSTPVIYHAVSAEQFPFVEEPGDYLLFLGRFTPGKGPLAAIEAAREAGMSLLLAGPENSYFAKEVAPLVDGLSVQYVGSVTGRARADLIGGARALLYPIAEPEPFGLVMPEAMMCGTPVVATCLGAVPEIIEHGITGCIANAPADLPTQIERAISLDRRLVRRGAEERFSGERMAREYVEVYEGVRRPATDDASKPLTPDP